jgi:hypothetical protein
MEPQLSTLIDLEGLQTLVHKYFIHAYDNLGNTQWCFVTGVEPGHTGRVQVADENLVPYGAIDPQELRIGLGTRLRGDTLLDKLRARGLESEPCLMAVLDAPVQPPRVQVPQPSEGMDRAGTPVGAAGMQDARNVSWAQTPAFRALQGGLEKPLYPTSAFLLEKTVRQLVLRGSLLSDMETILGAQFDKSMKAWHRKAAAFFDVYKEANPLASHLLAAVYFYATRLNYSSLDLEWMANGFVSEMKAAIEAEGDSTTWSPEIVYKLETKIRRSYYEWEAKADKEIGTGRAKKLLPPGTGSG